MMIAGISASERAPARDRRAVRHYNVRPPVHARQWRPSSEVIFFKSVIIFCLPCIVMKTDIPID